MAIETNVPRSRRSLLTAVGAAFAGAVAATVAGAQQVLAAGDDARIIYVGSEYLDVRSHTWLTNIRTDADVLHVETSGGGTACVAEAYTGTGVHGGSTTGIGVQ